MISTPPRSRVLLTGATGFLGRALAAELEARGAEVHALVRASSHTTGLRATCHVVDLLDVARLEPLVAHVDYVIHAAGGGRDPDPAGLWRSNTMTTEALVRAIRDVAARPRSFVFVSSVAACGPLGGSGLVTAYGRAKRAGEAALETLPDETPWTVLRPPGIIGPGDARMLPLFRAARAGVVPFPRGQRALSFVYVDCCARAIADAALLDPPRGGIYYPTDGRIWSPSQVAEALGEAVGTRPRVLRVPRSALKAAATLAELTHRRSSRPLFLTRDKARELVQEDWSCDPSSLQRELGWQPEVDLVEGARRTAAALVDAGLLAPA